MSKYRIRLKGGRIVGPFLKHQIIELYEKGHVDGTEECQLFPAGEWLNFLEFEELASIVSEANAEDELENKTVLRKLSDLTKGEEKEETIEVSIPEQQPIEKLEITEKVIEEKIELKEEKVNTKQEDNFPKTFDYKNVSNKELTKSQKIQLPKEEEQVEKTIIKKIPANLSDSNKSKTQINPEALKQKEIIKEKERVEQVKKIEEQMLQEKEESKEELLPEVFNPDGATQMLDIKELKIIKSEAKNAESELQLIEAELKLEQAKEKKEKLESNKEKKQVIKEVEKKNNKKPILIVAALLIVAFLMMPDEKPKVDPNKIEIFKPKIDFPVPFKQENQEMSKQLYDKGIELLKQNEPKSIFQASLAFRESLEHKFNANPALTKLILSYSELLEDDEKDILSGNEIFKLIQIARTKGLHSDLNLAEGTAIFYYHFRKYPAATKIIEDFLSVHKQKSMKLISTYINVLNHAGNLTKAKTIIDKYAVIKEKNSDLYFAIADYYRINNEIEQSIDWVNQGLKHFPNAIKLWSLYGDLVIAQENYKDLEKIIAKIKELKAANSRTFYSKLLEFQGMHFAYAKNKVEAVKYFKEAIKQKESSDLISKLAALEAPEGDQDNLAALINTSKAMDFMSKARESMRRKNWQSAFAFAIEAADVAKKYYPAKLLLAEIQTKQGYFNQAIQTLTTLMQEYPNERLIQYALINTYTESYKFKDALLLLDALGAAGDKQSFEYISSLGRYYSKQGDYFQAVTWLQKSITVNPIFDEDYFILAQTYLKNRSYQKAKVVLTKAMDLDPSNVDYKVSYSKIIYEMEDSETAIGFLRSALEQNPNDPTLMSEIAIYYFRSGQHKYFEEYKKQLEDMPDRTSALYKFLMKAAEIDDRSDDLIKYGNELVKIEPGDLESRMKLAEILSQNKKNEEALEQLNFIEERLPTYPRLLYLRSKILLDMGKKDDAIAVAKKELELNPNSEDGNVLLGNVYVNLNDYPQAENYYKNAQKINAKSVDALLGLAWINYQRNNAEVAMDLYSKVVKLDPNNSYAHKQLGMVYKLLGQTALAIESFEVYLKIEPDAKDKDKINGYIKELQ